MTAEKIIRLLELGWGFGAVAGVAAITFATFVVAWAWVICLIGTACGWVLSLFSKK